MTKEMQERISQLSAFEQQIQQYSAQKQQFSMQLAEVESALKEIESSREQYKVLGNIMVAVPKEALKLELEEKKELLNLRIDSFEKQEARIKEKAQSLQKEVLDGMKDDTSK
jgi:prefoldin beta subunit